jgi:ABC-type lipoprotein export system ATPase subunit
VIDHAVAALPDVRRDAVAPVVDLRGVGRTFDTTPPVHALVDVDLTVERGDWLAVVGPSGSGKSTLLNVLGLLDVTTSGTYLLDGIDVSGLTDAERTAVRGERIGFVFQSFHLLSHRSVLENVSLAEVYGTTNRRFPRAGRRQRAATALERVGLGHRLDFLPSRLSGGERQRVAIARSLVTKPSLLLADEPTGNLDTHTTESILELFQSLRADDLTIIMITHDPEVAVRAGRSVRIRDGVLT